MSDNREATGSTTDDSRNDPGIAVGDTNEESEGNSDLPTSSTDEKIFIKVPEEPSTVTSSNGCKTDELTTVVYDGRVSTDADVELEISMSQQPCEAITENVDDLVNDLETLLGESNESFNLTYRSADYSTVAETTKTEKAPSEESPSTDTDVCQSSVEENVSNSEVQQTAEVTQDPQEDKLEYESLNEFLTIAVPDIESTTTDQNLDENEPVPSEELHHLPEEDTNSVDDDKNEAEVTDDSAEAEVKDDSAEAEVKDDSAEAEVKDDSAEAEVKDDSAEAEVRSDSAEAEVKDNSPEAEVQEDSAEAQPQPEESCKEEETLPPSSDVVEEANEVTEVNEVAEPNEAISEDIEDSVHKIEDQEASNDAEKNSVSSTVSQELPSVSIQEEVSEAVEYEENVPFSEETVEEGVSTEDVQEGLIEVELNREVVPNILEESAEAVAKGDESQDSIVESNPQLVEDSAEATSECTAQIEAPATDELEAVADEAECQSSEDNDRVPAETEVVKKSTVEDEFASQTIVTSSSESEVAKAVESVSMDRDEEDQKEDAHEPEETPVVFMEAHDSPKEDLQEIPEAFGDETEQVTCSSEVIPDTEEDITYKMMDEDYLEAEQAVSQLQAIAGEDSSGLALGCMQDLEEEVKIETFEISIGNEDEPVEEIVTDEPVIALEQIVEENQETGASELETSEEIQENCKEESNDSETGLNEDASAEAEKEIEQPKEEEPVLTSAEEVNSPETSNSIQEDVVTSPKEEDLSTDVDKPLNIHIENLEPKERVYSPKVIIKPIEEPCTDKEPALESEVNKTGLKMTILKQADDTHSVLQVYNPDKDVDRCNIEEPIPKLIIKSKTQVEQHSPKISLKTNRRSSSPASPLKDSKSHLKAESRAETLSPLKITFKPVPEPDEPLKQQRNSPKMCIKSDGEQRTHSPRITIKPIAKPPSEELSKVKLEESVGEVQPVSPKVTIKPVKRQDAKNEEGSRHSARISSKPTMISDPLETEPEETKERIVLKINKGNLPVQKKREFVSDEEKSEKLGTIKVKFSKDGGHPHIINQSEESNKRAKKSNDQASKETEYFLNKRLSEDGSLQRNKKFRGMSVQNNLQSNDKIDESRSLPSTDRIPADDLKDPMDMSHISELSSSPFPVVRVSPTIVNVVTTVVATTPPRKRGRPRKIQPVTSSSTDGSPAAPASPAHAPGSDMAAAAVASSSSSVTARPKRSCRGQNVIATLGIKPRKPRGGGRGRGGKVNMGTRTPPLPPIKLSIKKKNAVNH